MLVTSQKQLQTYREATRISTEILAVLRDSLAPGVLPSKIDKLAGELCRKHQVKPAFQGEKSGRKTYSYNSCISINQAILHGIPSNSRHLEIGDLVKLDFGIIYQGLYTDQCVTVGIKKVTEQDKYLLRVGRKAVQNAVKLAVTGKTTGDLGYIMNRTARKAGFETLKNYTGHGIGQRLHELPEIPAHGQRNSGTTLKDGQVLCIETQLVAGSDQVKINEDSWTVETEDGQRGVMFEYMVVVRKNKPEILTKTLDWPLVV